MNKNAIVLGIVAFLALILAVVFGSLVAKGSYKYLGVIFAATFLLLLCVGFRQNIWMFIPLCGSLTGTIGVLPIPGTLQAYCYFRRTLSVPAHIFPFLLRFWVIGSSSM